MATFPPRGLPSSWTFTTKGGRVLMKPPQGSSLKRSEVRAAVREAKALREASGDEPKHSGG